MDERERRHRRVSRIDADLFPPGGEENRPEKIEGHRRGKKHAERSVRPSCPMRGRSQNGREHASAATQREPANAVIFQTACAAAKSDKCGAPRGAPYIRPGSARRSAETRNGVRGDASRRDRAPRGGGQTARGSQQKW